MTAFPSAMVYDHFAKTFIQMGALPHNMPPLVYVVEVRDGAIADVTEMPSDSTADLLSMPDGQTMLLMAVKMMVADMKKLIPDAFAVVMVGEVSARLVPGSSVRSQADLDALTPDYNSPTKLIISINRPEGCKTGLIPIGEDRKLTYVPMETRDAVLVPCSRDPGDNDDGEDTGNGTTVNMTIH